MRSRMDELTLLAEENDGLFTPQEARGAGVLVRKRNARLSSRLGDPGGVARRTRKSGDRIRLSDQDRGRNRRKVSRFCRKNFSELGILVVNRRQTITRVTCRFSSVME
jgi:hypothetical protein